MPRTSLQPILAQVTDSGGTINFATADLASLLGHPLKKLVHSKLGMVSWAFLLVFMCLDIHKGAPPLLLGTRPASL